MSTRKMKIMQVTPAIAERWLNTCNTHNRPLRNQHVDRLAQAMLRGEWRLTAEPVMFCGPYTDELDEKLGDTLLNGQHRLWAIVQSQTSVELTVWWGCDPEEFQVIDQNAVRTLGDVLSTTRRDLGDATLIASVASAVARYALGMTSHAGGKLTTAQLNEILAVHEVSILRVVQYKKGLRKMAPRAMLGALFLAHIANPSMADLIVEQLKSAVGFTDRDPMRALHLYITDHVTSTTKDTEDVLHYKICHAISARLRGDALKILKITGEGLGWLRDAARPKINELVKSLHGGKVPHNFYSPKLMLAHAPLKRIQQMNPTPEL